MSQPKDFQSSAEPVVREETTSLTDPKAAELCALFADGLDSGMGYIRILDMVSRQNFDDKIVDRLRTAIQQDGHRLGEAFARYGLLDPTARKLILVAEQQGTLPSTFQDLSAYYSKRYKRRKKFVTGLVEPSILIALSFIILNIITGGLEQFLEDLDMVAYLGPVFTKSAIQIAIFGTVVTVSLTAYLRMPLETPFRDIAHRTWLNLPLGALNKAGRLHSLAVFFRHIRKSLTSGLTVHHGLELAAEASNNPDIEHRIAAARRAIKDGQTLAGSLQMAEAVPREAIDYIDVGEESGQLEKRLDELADRYEEQAQESYQIKRKVMLYVLRFLIVIVVIVTVFATVLSLPAIILEQMGNRF